MKLEEIIRQHRESSGLSQLEFAQLAGIGKTTVYDIEHGKTTVRWSNLLKALNALNIKISVTSGLNPEYIEIEM